MPEHQIVGVNEKLEGFLYRLMQVMEHFGISSINELATKQLGYKSAQKINRLKDDGTKPSVEIVADVIDRWPEINANWLLLGHGNMLAIEAGKGLESSNLIEEPETIEVSLKAIRTDLRKVLNHQVRTRAEIRGFGEYQVMKDAKNNDHRRIEIMAQISRLIDANLEDDAIVGNLP